MRIENIILSNYRLYKGKNKIEFAPDDSGKNIYLVSGQNGFGKTTFLQSLLWCLYGKLIADIDETLKKEIANSGGYNAFLIKNLNITARQQVEEIKKEDVQRIKRNGYAPSDKKLKENAIYSVSIHFGDVAIPSIPCKTFTVIRSYDFIKAEQETECNTQEVKTPLPCVICTTENKNIPLSNALISGQIKAQDAQIKTLTLEDLDIEVQNVGIKGSPTYVSNVFRPIHNRKGEIINPDEAIEFCKSLVNGVMQE